MFGNTFRSTKHKRIPLSAWMGVTGIALLIFVILGTFELPNSHAFQHPQQNAYLNFQFRLKNLEAELRQEQGKYRVISFGSSLLASAVARDSFFNARLQNNGRAISVHRLFFPGAIYKFLEDPHLIGFLERTQPDLLCIEDQTFLYEVGKHDLAWPRPWLSDLHHTFVYNMNTLKHLLLPRTFPEPGFDGVTDSTLTFDQDQAELDSVITPQDSLNFEFIERTVRRKTVTKNFNRLVRSLAESGTQTVIINIPRPTPVESRYLTDAWKLRREKLIRHYQNTIDLEYWSFPHSLPFRYFWDTRHMNGEGRRIYSNWLLERIQQYADRRTSPQ